MALEREPMALEDILSDALEAAHEQAEQAYITLTGCVGAPLPVVHLDARQLHRVLMHLLQNAIRYTPAGGRVVVCAAPCEGAGGRHHVLVRVLDSGEGIAAADLLHIFEPTYRGEAARTRQDVARSASGAGLGLAIAREIIAAHGDTIWAESPLPPDLRALLTGQGDVSLQPNIVGAALSFTLPAMM